MVECHPVGSQRFPQIIIGKKTQISGLKSLTPYPSPLCTDALIKRRLAFIIDWRVGIDGVARRHIGTLKQLSFDTGPLS